MAKPTTANGQRSRSHNALNSVKLAGAIPSTYRSCDSLLQISLGANPLSSSGTLRKSNTAPRPASLVISGKALDRPPAPTS